MSKKKFEATRRYNETANGYDRRYREIQFTKFREVIMDLGIQNSNIILDIGGGTGLILDFNTDFIRNTVICDISFEMLKEGRNKQRRGLFVCADSEEPPFRNSCTDYTFLFSILQNLEKPDRTFTESFRTLKKNGKIVITALSKIFEQNMLEEILIRTKFILEKNWLLSIEDIAIIGKKEED